MNLRVLAPLSQSVSQCLPILATRFVLSNGSTQQGTSSCTLRNSTLRQSSVRFWLAVPVILVCKRLVNLNLLRSSYGRYCTLQRKLLLMCSRKAITLNFVRASNFTKKKMDVNAQQLCRMQDCKRCIHAKQLLTFIRKVD
jgi:hypothetical protein